MKKVIIGFILGMMVSGLVVYAATTIASSKVSYDNKTSKSSSTNVQGAIDELYSDAVAGKTKIAQAITNKGINTLSTDSYDTIIQNINNISVGNPNLRFNEEIGYIQAFDDSGNWQNIFKTSHLPINSFDGVLFNNGTYNESYWNSDYSHSYSSYGGAGVFSSESVIKFKKEVPPAYHSIPTITMTHSIDVTNYNVLKIEISSYKTQGGSQSIGLRTTTDTLSTYGTPSDSVVEEKILSVGTISFDVSSLKGNLYFYWWCNTSYDGDNSRTNEVSISKVWLE